MIARATDLSSMQRFAFIVLLSLCSGRVCAGDHVEPDCVRATEWKEEANLPGLIIYSRTRVGSSLKEFKSVGKVDAPSSAVFAVLHDVEAYPSFMPFTLECRVLKQVGDCTVAYQRLELPMLSDRDYTLRSEYSETPGRNGATYRIQWVPANDLGPAEKPGVQRVKVCEGGWLIEPDQDGTTRATYSIYTDSGGAIPAFIANRASRVAIARLFAAIRKEVLEPKYASAKN